MERSELERVLRAEYPDRSVLALRGPDAIARLKDGARRFAASRPSGTGQVFGSQRRVPMIALTDWVVMPCPDSVPPADFLRLLTRLCGLWHEALMVVPARLARYRPAIVLDELDRPARDALLDQLQCDDRHCPCHWLHAASPWPAHCHQRGHTVDVWRGADLIGLRCLDGCSGDDLARGLLRRVHDRGSRADVAAVERWARLAWPDRYLARQCLGEAVDQPVLATTDEEVPA